MGFFYFLLIVAILAVVVMVGLLMSKKEEDQEDQGPITAPTSKQLGKNLGSPLFTDDTKRFAMVLHESDWVWVLTPYGPQRMQVKVVKAGEAHLLNAEFEALAFLDAKYMSESVASKMNRGTGAWRLERMLPRQSAPHHSNDPFYEAENRRWLREEFYDDEMDLFDAMLFYYFVFDGFDQPYTYYEMQEVPVYDDPEPVPEPLPEEPVLEEQEPEMVEEPEVVEDVPAEVTEETFEEGIGDEPVPAPPEEGIGAPEPEPTPEPEPPAPEPEPYVPPTPDPEPYTPPAPDPEPDRSWDGGGDSYDSGSSYDSGGGGDDW